MAISAWTKACSGSLQISGMHNSSGVREIILKGKVHRIWEINVDHQFTDIPGGSIGRTIPSDGKHAWVSLAGCTIRFAHMPQMMCREDILWVLDQFMGLMPANSGLLVAFCPQCTVDESQPTWSAWRTGHTRGRGYAVYVTPDVARLVSDMCKGWGYKLQAEGQQRNIQWTRWASRHRTVTTS